MSTKNSAPQQKFIGDAVLAMTTAADVATTVNKQLVCIYTALMREQLTVFPGTIDIDDFEILAHRDTGRDTWAASISVLGSMLAQQVQTVAHDLLIRCYGATLRENELSCPLAQLADDLSRVSKYLCDTYSYLRTNHVVHPINFDPDWNVFGDLEPTELETHLMRVFHVGNIVSQFYNQLEFLSEQPKVVSSGAIAMRSTITTPTCVGTTDDRSITKQAQAMRRSKPK